MHEMARDESKSSDLRSALIEAAAQLIATEGAAGLTLRGVADAVGTSTMAIYTHFGGMPELRRAVRREGFARLAEHLAEVRETEDAVADLALLGRAYYDNALSNPHLYRVMFMEQPLDEADAAARTETYEVLVAAMQRCIEDGRFAPADAADLATQFWALGHGVVSLQLARMLSGEEALRSLAGAIVNLFIAFGDEPQRARRALARMAVVGAAA